jgi:hypothetical protein
MASSEWICEQHPWLEWPHDDCAGPGMLREDTLPTLHLHAGLISNKDFAAFRVLLFATREFLEDQSPAALAKMRKSLEDLKYHVTNGDD